MRSSALARSAGDRVPEAQAPLLARAAVACFDEAVGRWLASDEPPQPLAAGLAAAFDRCARASPHRQSGSPARMADTLEHELVRDLQSIAERFDDESFARDVYRALTNRRWRKPDGPDGHVSFSWGRAEELVNGLRAERDRPALELAQTGGEGEVARAVGEELERLGWTSTDQDTSRRDADHAERDPQAPPADLGSRRSPNPDPHAAEREADAEADREQARTEA